MIDQSLLDEAKRILESEAFIRATEAVERHFVEEAASADANDNDRILEAMRHVRALRAVIAGLNAWAMTAKIKSDQAEKVKNGVGNNVA